MAKYLGQMLLLFVFAILSAILGFETIGIVLLAMIFFKVIDIEEKLVRIEGK